MLDEGLLFAGRYKLIKLLGRGGFSEVWLAEDDMTAVQTAVKVYAPGSGLDDAGIKLFTQEFSLVFDMNHTNLLRPTHFDCWNRMPYLILPYCKNGSAFNYITNDTPISEDECWNLLHDVAAGLAYLHEKNPPLIHQDIKPDNILISDEGHFMITDFGISARVRSTIRNGKAQEQSGGTLAYMGPERFSANPKPIMASDVWSLGAMMYELMTGGNPPFGNHGGVLQKNGADIPLIEEDFSQPLKDIVYACLAKETWERPSARKVEETAYNKLHGIVIPDNVGEDITSEPQEATGSEMNTSELPDGDFEAVISHDSQIKAPDRHPDSVVKSTGPTDKKTGKLTGNRKILYGIATVAVLLLAVIAGKACHGSNGDDGSMSAGMAVAPVNIVNYDSLAQVRITEAGEIQEMADTFLVNHSEDKYDEKYDKIEEIYAKAYDKLNEALANKDSLTADVSGQALQQKANVANALLGIYKDFMDMAKSLRDAGVAGTATDFENRAEKIKPYIETLIDTDKDEEEH